MQNVNIHQAKTHLSRYLEEVQRGEGIIICKNGEPIAILQSFAKAQLGKKRALGAWKGKIKMAADFDEMPEDFMRHFK